MGKKASCFLVSATALLCCPVLIVNALNVTDVYKQYNKVYELSYPDNTLDVIRKYTDSQKSVYKYHYIESSTFDDTKLTKRKKKLKDDLETLRSQLLNAYALSIEEIYTLEDKYIETKRNLKNVGKALRSKHIKVDSGISYDIPTDAKYKTAVRVKDIYDSRANLGDAVKPTNTACIVKDSSDEQTTFLTVSGVTVHPIWKGKVVNVTDNSVVVYHYNKVYTTYTGVSNVAVDVEDIVTQDTKLGESQRELVVQLRLDGQFVNCSKLYEGGEDDG